MKKDSIIRLARLFLWGWLFAYVAVLYNTNAIVAENNSKILLSIVALLALAILSMWIFMVCVKRPKIMQIMLWFIIIFFAAYSGLKDDPMNHIYLQDILYVLWSVILVIGTAGWCIADACKQKQEEEEIEIIEV